METQVQARTLLPTIRASMASIGVELPSPVRVRMVDPESVDVGRPDGDVLLGLTDQWVGADSRVTVTGIRILKGLPPVHFGRAVAHEIGHAWLAQHGSKAATAAIEEGVCELFAYAWLKGQPTRIAEWLRKDVRSNPNPTYGGGFRAVYGATRVANVNTVLSCILRDGRLP